MKQRVARSSAGLGRGNSQQIAAFHITVKPDFDALVRQLRKFTFPTLWTLDDLLPICGLATRADRVHLSRALRRAGVMPLRGKKISFRQQKLRAYVWCINGKEPADLRTDRDVRREYYRQRHVESCAVIHRIQQQIADRTRLGIA
jgi:hypothetical protein